MNGRMYLLNEVGIKKAFFADSQRKGIIIGRHLGCTCGDVNYAN